MYKENSREYTKTHVVHKIDHVSCVFEVQTTCQQLVRIKRLEAQCLHEFCFTKHIFDLDVATK